MVMIDSKPLASTSYREETLFTCAVRDPNCRVDSAPRPFPPGFHLLTDGDDSSAVTCGCAGSPLQNLNVVPFVAMASLDPLKDVSRYGQDQGARDVQRREDRRRNVLRRVDDVGLDASRDACGPTKDQEMANHISIADGRSRKIMDV